MMWTSLRRIKNCLLFVVLSFFAWPSICGAEPMYQITETQLSQLENNLNELQTNNETLLDLLNGSETDLMIAQEQLEKSKLQIEKLTAQLETLKAESDNAEKSLKIANAELQNVCESVKQLEAKKRRIERQRNLWQVIAATLGVIAVAK